MLVNHFPISLETLIGTSTMLGHKLEDRSPIRNAQDPSLLEMIQLHSSLPLLNARQQDLFAVAPLDILVSDHGNQKQFHLLEINGTGIGGFTNLPGAVIEPVLESIADFALSIEEPNPLILVAVSGKECDASPRLNKLVHEKIMYVEAIKQAFDSNDRAVCVTALPEIFTDPAMLHNGKPTIVLGYIKEFLDELTLNADGRLLLFDRSVSAAINDRFCLNIMDKFQNNVDLNRLATSNRCFLAGADKGIAYALLNDFLMDNPSRYLPNHVNSERVHSREELIESVLHWIRNGHRAVIKPQGTGLGHGIEFFLNADEPLNAVCERIDRSILLTEEYYHISGGAFPYTVCDYVDSSRIHCPVHAFHGHKYELRVVVYRDGMMLNAFPSIVKVASESFDEAKPSHLSLINNITCSAQATNKAGSDHMLPLANRQTLELLGLRAEHLIELCSFATRFMRSVLDRVQIDPGLFGLPDVVSPRTIEQPALRLVRAA